jgi:hypothetical protein
MLKRKCRREWYFESRNIQYPNPRPVAITVGNKATRDLILIGSQGVIAGRKRLSPYA